MSPEIVGVAVHAVPVTVRFPPSEVKLAPETVNVLSSVVAPWRVRAPGVVVEPIVLADEAAVPNVVLPDEVRVVNAPVKGVVAPIAVLLIPVAVVLKCPEVIVKSFAPVLIDEAESPERANNPEVPVRLTIPVVLVNPLAEVIVPVPVVEIFPVVDTDDGVIAPRPIVSLGVVVVFVQVADIPLLAAVVSTEVTVPVPKLEERTFSITPVDVFLVRRS